MVAQKDWTPKIIRVCVWLGNQSNEMSVDITEKQE